MNCVVSKEFHEQSVMSLKKIFGNEPCVWQQRGTIISPSGAADTENNSFIFKLHCVRNTLLSGCIINQGISFLFFYFIIETL